MKYLLAIVATTVQLIGARVRYLGASGRSKARRRTPRLSPTWSSGLAGSMIALLFVLALPRSLLAEPRLPRQFHGHWCGAADDEAGMQRVRQPCRGAEDFNSMTVTARRNHSHANDGSTYHHCEVVTAAKYEPRGGSYQNTYLARLSCDEPQANGVYIFELIEGRLIQKRYDALALSAWAQSLEEGLISQIRESRHYDSAGGRLRVSPLRITCNVGQYHVR